MNKSPVLPPEEDRRHAVPEEEEAEDARVVELGGEEESIVNVAASLQLQEGRDLLQQKEEELLGAAASRESAAAGDHEQNKRHPNDLETTEEDAPASPIVPAAGIIGIGMGVPVQDASINRANGVTMTTTTKIPLADQQLEPSSQEQPAHEEVDTAPAPNNTRRRDPAVGAFFVQGSTGRRTSQEEVVIPPAADPNNTNDFLAEATLVPDVEVQVREDHHHHVMAHADTLAGKVVVNTKSIAWFILGCLVVVGVVVAVVTVVLQKNGEGTEENMNNDLVLGPMNSTQEVKPALPFHSNIPTLQRIREEGVLRCGVTTVEIGGVNHVVKDDVSKLVDAAFVSSTLPIPLWVYAYSVYLIHPFLLSVQGCCRGRHGNRQLQSGAGTPRLFSTCRNDFQWSN